MEILGSIAGTLTALGALALALALAVATISVLLAPRGKDAAVVAVRDRRVQARTRAENDALHRRRFGRG